MYCSAHIYVDNISMIIYNNFIYGWYNSEK